jgi:hypothetical protein
MPSDAYSIIQALVKAQLIDDTYERGEKLHPVVALSRNYGCGGEEIGHALSKRLQVGYFDKEILNQIVSQSGGDKYLLERLDETVKSRWDSWILSFLSGDNVLNENYERLLINVLLGILDTGGVVMGRGAHLILAQHEIIRVRIIGSPDVCAKRVAEKEGLALEEARKKVDAMNHQRGKFIWDYWKHRLSDPTEFDLVINTDHFRDFSEVTELIIDAMHGMGIKTAAQEVK